MPELPEVETSPGLCGDARPGDTLSSSEWPAGVLGRKFADVQVAAAFYRRTAAAAFLHAPLRTKHFGNYTQGKILVFSTWKDGMLIHLRMSGVSGWNPVIRPTLGCTTGSFLIFADDARLVFKLQRKFGRAWLLKDPQQVLGTLGPETL